MFLIQALILIACVIVMLFSHKETKLVLFLFSFLCLNLFSLNMGPMTYSKNLLLFAYFISERESLLRSFDILKKYNIFGLVIAMIIPTVVLVINSPHYKSINGFITIFVYEMVLKYMVLWIGFTILSKQYNYIKLYRSTYYALIVLTIFAIVNLVFQSAPWIAWLGNHNYDAAVDLAKERFRVKALFTNSFNYGFMCVISLAFFYVGFLRKFVNKSMWYQVLAMCVFGILVHGSRTVLATSLILIIVVLLAQSTNSKRVYYIFGTIILVLILYYFVPMFNERMNLIIETFDPSQKNSGSSFEMRDMQLNAVLYYIQDNMIFGRGYRFFYNDLGWGQFYSGGRVDSDLRGLEGVHLNHLLERGVFGYVCYLLFYSSLLWILLKSIGGKVEKYMAITVLLVYVSFSHMTGELGTTPIALFYIGLLYRMSIYNKQIDNVAMPH